MDTINAAIAEAQAIAANLGFAPIDFDPSHSPIFQSAVAPKQAPVTVTVPGGSGAAPSGVSFGSIMTKPVLYGFTAPEIALGAGLLYFGLKALRGSRRR